MAAQSESPELSKELFIAMAEQVGFDPADPHLDALYPEVLARFTMIRNIQQVDVSGVDPAVHYGLGPTGEV